MSRHCWLPAVSTSALLCAATAACAQDLRHETLAMYGGRYALDCSVTTSPEARIGAATLVLQHGARRAQTPTRMDSYTSFGGAPTSPVPEGYEVEFIGDAFSLFVFKDGKGPYVPLRYTDAAAKLLGAASANARLRRCPR